MNQLAALYGSAARKPLHAQAFLVFIFLVVAMPTGSLFAVPVKSIALGVVIVLMAMHPSPGASILPKSAFYGLIAAVGFLLLWTTIGIIGNPEEFSLAIYQARDIGSVVLICTLATHYVYRRYLSPPEIIRAIFYGSVALSIFKISVLVASNAYGFDPEDFIYGIFGEGSFIPGGLDLSFYRIEFSNDVVAPFALFALLIPGISGLRMSLASRLIYTAILLVAGFYGFSRFNWALFVVAIIAAIFVSRNLRYIWIAIFCVIAGFLFFQSSIDDIVNARFLSDAAFGSDEVRSAQISALMNIWQQHPIIGSGLGAYASSILRSNTVKYAYEVQWVAFLMQTGIIGTAIASIGILATLHNIVSVRGAARFWLLILFAFWVASSFTNPRLTSSYAGAVFVLFLEIGILLRRPEWAPRRDTGFPMPTSAPMPAQHRRDFDDGSTRAFDRQ